MGWLDSASITLLNKDLDGLWTRQQAISDNIANVDTAGYKSKTVSFEDQLKSALENASSSESNTVSALSQVEPTTTVSDDEALTADGNNVDIEAQNVELARTQLNYLYSLQEMSDNFTRLRYAIKGGNG